MSFGVLTINRDASLCTNPLDEGLSSLSSPRLVAAFLKVSGASLTQVGLAPHEDVALRILGGERLVALARMSNDDGTEAGGGQDRQRAEGRAEGRHSFLLLLLLQERVVVLGSSRMVDAGGTVSCREATCYLYWTSLPTSSRRWTSLYALGLRACG